MEKKNNALKKNQNQCFTYVIGSIFVIVMHLGNIQPIYFERRSSKHYSIYTEMFVWEKQWSIKHYSKIFELYCAESHWTFKWGFFYYDRKHIT